MTGIALKLFTHAPFHSLRLLHLLHLVTLIYIYDVPPPSYLLAPPSILDSRARFFKGPITIPAYTFFCVYPFFVIQSQ